MLTSCPYNLVFRLIAKPLIACTIALVGLPLFFMLSALQAQPAMAAEIPQSNQGNYHQPFFQPQTTAITAATTITSPFIIYLPIVIRPDPGIINGNFELGRLNSPLIIGAAERLGPASINPPLNWTRFSLIGYELFFTQSSEPLSLPIPAESGSWATWLGGDNNEISYIQQQVNVPLGSPFLFYSRWTQSYDSLCGTFNFTLSDRLAYFVDNSIGGLPIDLGGITVDNNSGILGVVVFDLCQSAATNDWSFAAVDLSQYAGQNVIIQMRSKGDAIFTSSFFIDDVSLGGTSLTSNSSFETLSFVPQPASLSGSGNQRYFSNTDQSLSKSLLTTPIELESMTKKGHTLAPISSEK